MDIGKYLNFSYNIYRITRFAYEFNEIFSDDTILFFPGNKVDAVYFYFRNTVNAKCKKQIR